MIGSIFLIALEISSISVTTFCGIFIYGGCVPGPVSLFMLPNTDENHNAGNGSSDMSSNILAFNEFLKCSLLMLR